MRLSHPLSQSSFRGLRAIALSAAACAAFGTVASAQIPDFRVAAVEINQALPNGAIQVISDRATIVRTTVRMLNGPATPVFVDGLMRVYDGGVEIQGSPFFSDNGPIEVIQPANYLNIDHTLNFTFVMPSSSDLLVEVELNPPGPNQWPESNPTNNIGTKGPVSTKDLGIPTMVYAPIDYRPTGGTVPNLPDPELIKPGVGDNFIQGVYPVPDWNYRRIDAPSKLWTSSVASSGSALNNSLTADLNLMVPKPTYIYGWVIGGLSYNGQSIINGVAAMGNTQPIRHQRTFAHEIGHCTGLFHINNTTGLYGVDVEHHLKITEALPKVKPTSAFDIMVAGLLSNQAWVYTTNYNYFLNHPKFQPGAALTFDDGPTLYVAGVWNSETGAVHMTDVLTFPAGRQSASASAGSEVLMRAYAGGTLVRELAVATISSTDCSDADSETQSPLLGFNAQLPTHAANGAPIDRVVIAQGGERPLLGVELKRSANAPQVAFVSPARPQLDGPAVHVAWEGVDADGDELTYYLRWSRDGEQFSPIFTSTHETSIDVDLSQLPQLVDGKGFFEVFASDGLHTSVTRTEPLSGAASFAGVGGNDPWVNILTPDNNATLLKGANSILHGMGWDLEDFALTGGDLVWTSDVDGVIGTGKRTTVTSLTPGVHVITLTGTDGGGAQTIDSVTVTVVDRDLPDVGGDFCQTDLGFGGPGTATLSVCGGDLSTGTTADLLLTGAATGTTAWLVQSLAALPTPFKGGTLVPIPVLAADPYATGGAGQVAINAIPGGGGPFTVVIQFVIQDAAQVKGYAFSNAVQVAFLP